MHPENLLSFIEKKKIKDLQISVSRIPFHALSSNSLQHQHIINVSCLSCMWLKPFNTLLKKLPQNDLLWRGINRVLTYVIWFLQT